MQTNSILNIAPIAGQAWRLLVSTFIGFAAGIDREKHKGEGPKRSAAGLRTFALVALLGGVSAQTGLLAVVTGAIALSSYWLGDRADPGITTEIALALTFVLGVLAQTQPVMALGAGAVMVGLLATKTTLHHMADELLSERELMDGLTFAIAAAVVWPMLPNRPIDHFGLFNPFSLWRLAVVLMALSSAGYVGMRIAGPRYGLAIAGFASGFVSSTACIAAMGARARESEEFSAPGAGGAIASIIGSLLYLAGLVAAADVEVLRQLAAPFFAAAAATCLYAIMLASRSGPRVTTPQEPGRAFHLKTILLFASLVTVFSLISVGLISWFGRYAVFESAVATGVIDVHAAAVTIATLIASGRISAGAGATAILIALTANMAAKIPAAYALGPRRFALRVSSGLCILLAGLWAGYAWSNFAVR